MQTSRGTFFNCLALMLFLGGCAKVGDPLPPLIEVPSSARDVELVVEGGDSVLLTFPPPADPVVQVRLYRGCGDSPVQPAEQVAEVALSQLETFGDSGRLFLSDSNPGPGRPCAYAIRFLSAEGRESHLSNVVVTLETPVPGPPVGLTADVREDRIEFNWAAPASNIDGSLPPVIDGYLVNRSVFVRNPAYVLEEFQFGKLLELSVQTVGRRKAPMVLSSPADIRVRPIDSFPPSPPENLSAVAVGDGVQLLWDEPDEERPAGYYVYRRGEDEDYRRLSGLLTGTRFVDSEATVGQIVYYVVTAVDERGNQSPFSDSVRISVSR